jgi:hypothetical protein
MGRRCGRPIDRERKLPKTFWRRRAYRKGGHTLAPRFGEEQAVPKSEKAKEVHRRLKAEQGDPAKSGEDLADQLVDLVAHLDADVVRALVTRDSRRLTEKKGRGDV